MKLLNNGKHLVVGDKVGDIYFLDFILNNLKNMQGGDDMRPNFGGGGPMNSSSDDQRRISTKIADLVDLSYTFIWPA